MIKRIVFVGLMCMVSLMITAKIVEVAKRHRPTDNIYAKTPDKTEPKDPDPKDRVGE